MKKNPFKPRYPLLPPSGRESEFTRGVIVAFALAAAALVVALVRSGCR